MLAHFLPMKTRIDSMVHTSKGQKANGQKNFGWDEIISEVAIFYKSPDFSFIFCTIIYILTMTTSHNSEKNMDGGVGLLLVVKNLKDQVQTNNEFIKLFHQSQISNLQIFLQIFATISFSTGKLRKKMSSTNKKCFFFSN